MVKLTLRISDANLYKQVTASAKANGRSINSEIVWQLRRAYEAYRR